MSKPLIFITNDDGIDAPGIRFLIETVRNMGDIVVVAPDKAQSGMSHALTIGNFLRFEEITMEENYREYCCTGTPADCLKLAVHHILNRKPDFILSGINHGSNASINIIYSGTMAAALEGAIIGVPAVGFSLLDYSNKADFTHTASYIRNIVTKLIKHGLPTETCLNVNFPANSEAGLKGVKVCRQARSSWDDEYLERLDPHGKSYYWLTGKFINFDKEEDTDEWALENNYVSIVPAHIDLTSYSAIPLIKNWNLDA